MNKSSLLPTLIAFLFTSTFAANIHAVSPPELKNLFKQPINAHLSPIGFKPMSGRLEGSIVLADPIGACSKIKDIKSQNEDIFVLADDTQCLQSVKAKNIAASGGYVGIIKQNINNTLFDKQISLVHIPILQIANNDYNILEDFVKKNPDVIITLSIDFTDGTQTHPINMEVWFSPTEKSTYQFMLKMKNFINKQDNIVSFAPHYVLQSQRQTKNYIGCLSSGRYCPSQIQFQGKYEGKNIVEQSLKQIILWDMSPEDWWIYIEYFYMSCLKDSADIFLSTKKLTSCTQNAMIMAGIDSIQLNKEYNNSFLGNRKEVDDNTYLLEERQHYIREQISTHPIVLVNKKSINVDYQAVQERICKMQGDNPSQECAYAKDQLSTTQVLIIISVVLALFITIAALYRLYMHIRMRNQIKTEVDKTLEQYYRYISTFEGDKGKIGSPKSKNQKNSRELTEELEEVAHEYPVSASSGNKEMQMRAISGK